MIAQMSHDNHFSCFRLPTLQFLLSSPKPGSQNQTLYPMVNFSSSGNTVIVSLHYPDTVFLLMSSDPSAWLMTRVKALLPKAG